MIERPAKIAPNGFGKRGSITLNRQVSVAPSATPAPSAEPAAESGGGFTIPKWAIGAMAGVVMLALVGASGGVGGGGFLGGLLGGMLAGKMMNSGKMPGTTSAAPRSTAAAPAAVSPGAHDSVTRGGFGTTASSPAKSGGFSFGG